MACFLPSFKIIIKYRLSKSLLNVAILNFSQQWWLFMLKKNGKSSSIVFLFDCFETSWRCFNPVLIFCIGRWKDFKHAINYRIVCRFLAPSIFLLILPSFFFTCFVNIRFFPLTYTCIHTRWLSVLNCTGQRRLYEVLCETSCFYLCSKAESTCNNTLTNYTECPSVVQDAETRPFCFHVLKRLCLHM